MSSSSSSTRSSVRVGTFTPTPSAPSSSFEVSVSSLNVRATTTPSPPLFTDTTRATSSPLADSRKRHDVESEPVFSEGSATFLVENRFDIWHSRAPRDGRPTGVRQHGRLASFGGNTTFTVDSFFDITYRLDGGVGDVDGDGDLDVVIPDVRFSSEATELHTKAFNIHLNISTRNDRAPRLSIRNDSVFTVDSFFDVFTERTYVHICYLIQ